MILHILIFTCEMEDKLIHAYYNTYYNLVLTMTAKVSGIQGSYIC